MDDHIQLKEDAFKPHSVLEVYTVTYNCVCGRIRGHQFGAFCNSAVGIDSYTNNVNSISRTHGVLEGVSIFGHLLLD